jgi:hypothetical protein
MIALVLLGVYIAAAAAIGHWMLWPVNQRAGILRLPNKFMLSDLLWLMIQLQIVLAVCVPLYSTSLLGVGRWIVLGVLALCVVALWAASVSVVSRAGITQPLRRAVVLLVLVPGALAVITTGPCVVLAAVFVLLGRMTDSELIAAALFASAWGIAAIAFGLRYLSFWVLTTPHRAP